MRNPKNRFYGFVSGLVVFSVVGTMGFIFAFDVYELNNHKDSVVVIK